MKFTPAAFALAAIVLAAPPARADFQLPLDLRPDGGAAGMRCISNGIPLAPGAAADIDQLHVIGPDGKEVPSQYRVLARWWRQDNSIRWVLVDFLRNDSEPAKGVYTLVGRKDIAPRPKTPLAVAQDAGRIRIDTGAARFEIDRKHFNLLDRVVIDGKALVGPDPRMGSVTENPAGRKYYSSKGTGEVRVLESGPVRVTVMAKGVHRSDEPGAAEQGLYGFEVYMTFHAGKRHCDVDAILTNNFLKPHGEPNFEDWSVLVGLGDRQGGPWSLTPLAGPEAVSGQKGESALLYQDSLGTDRWKEFTGLIIPGGRKAPQPDVATFRGFRLWRVAGEIRTEVAAGDYADGRASAVAGQARCTIQPRNFWQQFPSALQFGGDGVLRLGVFPREYKSVHWLEDASAKGQEFRLTFGPPAPGDEGYFRRTVALPATAYYAQVGALSEFDACYQDEFILKQDIDTMSSAGKVLKERRSVSDTHKSDNAYGWQIFGHLRHEVGGHTPWNYEPLATSGKLMRFVLTGNPGWYEWGIACDRAARDVRAYLIDDQDNLAVWKTWPEYVANCVREEWPRRLPNKGLHPYDRFPWILPNQEHHNLDEVYDLYLLTGDHRARRCMETIADHAAICLTLKYGPEVRRRPRRMVGWTIRTLGRYYELTGDKRFQPYLREGIDQIWHDVNKAGPTDEKGGNWYLGIYARGAINAWRASGDERMRDLAIGVADWAMTYEVNPEQGYGYQQFPDPWNHKPTDRSKVLPEKFKKYWYSDWCNGYMLAMFGFAWQQTGDRRYADAFDFALEKNNGNYWLGLFAGELYMRRAPRPDDRPPVAITDLKATADPGRVTLSWTAPGDDGAAGKAAVYQIKYSTKPILEIVPFPEKMDTHITFWGSENVPHEPAPQPAGTAQTYALTGLKPGTYYFAIKARDESRNQSPLSNVASAEVK